MKKLEIIMSIKANNTFEAECIAQRELMDLARVIARQNGSAMASGEGNAIETGDGNYKVEASIKVNANDVSEIVHAAQVLWMTKPEILKSAIFVSEEESAKAKEPEEPKVMYSGCGRCGKIERLDELTIVNPEMEDEYYLCEECYEDAQNEDEIIDCCNCMNTVDVDKLVTNPVTHSKSICPICGENLWNA